ncbi:MAG: hypothetical protein AAGF01_15960 [Cyanobacteria bacterium P01_G01_bin.38]
MHDAHLSKVIEAVHHPERAFKMYLRQTIYTPRSRKSFPDWELPSVFSQALVHYLFNLTNHSGFVDLDIHSEFVRKDQKLLVRWKSGISKQDYLDEKELKQIRCLARDYYRNQIARYLLADKQHVMSYQKIPKERR